MGGPGSGPKQGQGGFKAGKVANPKGRPKGSANKVSLDIRERIEELTNGEPLPVLLTRIGLREIGRKEDGNLQIAHRCLVDACKYAYPQLRSIEHSGKIDSMPQITVVLHGDGSE